MDKYPDNPKKWKEEEVKTDISLFLVIGIIIIILVLIAIVVIVMRKQSKKNSEEEILEKESISESGQETKDTLVEESPHSYEE